MKNAVCFFLMMLFIISLLLAPVFVTVEVGERFDAEWAACAHHAHGSIRLLVPSSLSNGCMALKETVLALIPPFLREPLRIPLHAVGKLHALFVELLREELGGCQGRLPLS